MTENQPTGMGCEGVCPSGAQSNSTQERVEGNTEKSSKQHLVGECCLILSIYNNISS